jgi:hypothetical protein
MNMQSEIHVIFLLFQKHYGAASFFLKQWWFNKKIVGSSNFLILISFLTMQSEMTLRKDVKEVRLSEKTVSFLSLSPFFYFAYFLNFFL